MNLAAIAADVRCLARTRGTGEALRRLGRGVADSLYSRQELLVLLKSLDAIAPSEVPARLELRELDRSVLPALAAFSRARCDSRAIARFTAHLDSGYRGFVAHEDGTVAGYYWWVDDHHPHLERLGIALRPGDAYGFDFLLAEERRGEGRAIEFLHHVETRLRRLGYHRVWGYVASANTPARWLYRMRGYEVTHTVRRKPGEMR